MEKLHEIREQKEREFLKLYSFITQEMQSYASESDFPSDVEKIWIERMIKLFHERYDRWGYTEKKYLEYLYSNNKSKLFDMAALAYLHIGIDLPIAIDQARREVEAENKIELDPLRCDYIFKEIGRVIREGLELRWTGKYKLPLWILKCCAAEGAVNDWVDKHRFGAWSNYINIRDSSDNQKPEVIDGIRKNMFTNLENALRIKIFPWGRAGALQVPSPLVVATKTAIATTAFGATSLMIRTGSLAIGVETLLGVVAVVGGLSLLSSVITSWFQKRKIKKMLKGLDDNV